MTSGKDAPRRPSTGFACWRIAAHQERIEGGRGERYYGFVMFVAVECVIRIFDEIT